MKTAALLCLLIATSALASPVLQMNRAFLALSELIPYLSDEKKFKEKTNRVIVEKNIQDLGQAFKDAKHASLLKEDLFAPSYSVIRENLDQSLAAFKKGDTDFSHWRLQEMTAQCLDCHTRLPSSYASSFQNGEMTVDTKKFKDPYDLGLAQMIVRRYTDAKASFTRSIQDRLIMNDETRIEQPFKQILLMGTKVLKDPENQIAFFSDYLKNDKLSPDMKARLRLWVNDLKEWKNETALKEGFRNDKEVEQFIHKRMKPLTVAMLFDGSRDVDLLLASGLLSHYFFENPDTKLAPDLSFWLGWAEIYLKRENFFGSGDRFLKQCIRRYPKHPIAQQCFETYNENVEFEFSGSAGTNIPADMREELKQLESLIKKK
jgi:hypothetical protein